MIAVPAGQRRQAQNPSRTAGPSGCAFRQGPGAGSLEGHACNDQPVVDVPLLALAAIEQAGAPGRAWMRIRLWIKWSRLDTPKFA